MATVSTPNTTTAAARAAGAQRTDAPADAAGVPDPQLVAEMKHEINLLVQEITHLAAQDISAENFYSGFLTRIVSAMGAIGGVVWTISENGQVKLGYQINLSQTAVDASATSRTQHARLLKTVIEQAQAVIMPANSGLQEDRNAANPTDLLLLLTPLVVDGQAQALVEVFQRPGGAASAQRGYLRFLLQMAELACGYLKGRRLRQLEENQAMWRQLETLVLSLHASLDVRETAYAIVNEGRRMIGCDRVSLAIACGSHCHIQAVSGLDSIDRRSAEVRSLARLCDAALQTNEPLWSDGSDDELPPQIQTPLQLHFDQSHARAIAVLPLHAPDLQSHGAADDAAGDKPERRLHQRPMGALIVEQLRDSQLTETLRTRSSIVAHHSARALANATEHSSVFLLGLWKSLGKMAWLFRGRTLPKTALTLGVVAAIITALTTVPIDFEVAARGKLQPAQRREIFAPVDGLVERVAVEHGQNVEAGAVLVELSNTDLDLQAAALLGRKTTNQERLTSLSRALLDNKGGAARLSPADENRLTGEMLQLQQESQNIDRELTLVRDKQRQLTVLAPQRGQVVTWKVRDLLLKRPVARGQGLLTLADPDGPWELELNLPERRLMHVQAEKSDSLPVTFVLSSHPGQSFRGHVVEIEQTAEVRGDEGNTILVRVAVNKDELPPRHDQTTVTAKLKCGRTSVGYAWFCDAIETVQMKILFWLPS